MKSPSGRGVDHPAAAERERPAAHACAPRPRVAEAAEERVDAQDDPDLDTVVVLGELDPLDSLAATVEPV